MSLERVIWFFSLGVQLGLDGGGSKARPIFLAWGWGNWEGGVGAAVIPSTKLCTVCSTTGKEKVREETHGNSPFKDNFN